MKRFITGIIISIMMLTGCVGPNVSIEEIGGIHTGTAMQEPLYAMKQDNIIAFQDLEKQLQKNNISFRRVSGEDDPISQYNVLDENARVTIVVDNLKFPNNSIITQIIIETLNNNVDLSEHPIVKIIANVMGEEKVVTWITAREEQVKQTKENNDIIQTLLDMDRCYLFFEYWPGSDTRKLEFTWALKPNTPIEFEDIARKLEHNGLLVTNYIEGSGGQKLTVANPQYYFLTKSRYHIRRQADVDTSQSAAYHVMYDESIPNSYSVQLYGHMKEDLSYVTKVEEMPGLHEISRVMNIDDKDFNNITIKINEELTKARELLNPNLQREYYSEGDIGGYHYIVTVPEGIGIYNFTVLIESR